MTVSANVEEQAYVKQLRSVDPSYLPLYNPNPWARDDVYVGDVGVIQDATFRPLFNVTMKAAHARNGGDVPENFEPLQFSPSSDLCIRTDPAVIKKFEPCFGDSRLRWSREDPPTREADGEERNEDHPSFSYKFTKNTPEPSYVLLAMADVEETVLAERQMEAWRHYMEKHHKNWLKYIRKTWLDPNFKAEEIILVCGFVKTSRWIIATLPQEGTYWLDIQDTPVGLQPSLKLGTQTIKKGVRYGQDMVEGDRELMQHFAQLAGLRVPADPQPIRKRCLFLTGLRLEKDFWSPKRIVAAAGPRDPRCRDEDDFGDSPSCILTPAERSDPICQGRRPAHPCCLEAALQGASHDQACTPAVSARPPAHLYPSPPWPLENASRHLIFQFPASETPLSSPIPVTVF